MASVQGRSGWEDVLEAVTRWIETEEPRIDGQVAICAVRSDEPVPRDGIRIALHEGEPQAFDAFYERFAHPAVVVLAQEPGAVVLAGGHDHPDEPLEFAIAALDALDVLAPALRGLTAEEICVAPDGSPRLVPRFRAESDPSARIDHGLARFLEPCAEDDPRLRAGIDALLDPTPEVRRTSRARFAGSTPAATLTRTGELKLQRTQPAPPRSPVDATAARAVVLIPPSALRTLSPGQRSAAAGQAGVSLAVVDGLDAAGLPLVLEAYGRSRSARKAAERVIRETGLPAEASSGGSVVALAWAGSLAITGVATAFATFVLHLVGLTVLPVVGTGLSAVLFGLSGRTGWTWWSQRRLLADARDAIRESAEERERRRADPLLARGFAVLAEARRALAASRLPSAPATDVRSVLRAVEAELDRLVVASAALRRQAASRPSEDLARELAALDEGPSRSRLERELERARRSEAQQQAIEADAQSLERVLSTMLDALSGWAAEPGDDAALEALVRAAHEARELARTHRTSRKT
jgi:hypothetical protein